MWYNLYSNDRTNLTAAQIIHVSQPDLTYLGGGVADDIPERGTFSGEDAFGNSYSITIDQETYLPSYELEKRENFIRPFQDGSGEWQINSVDVSKWYWGTFAPEYPIAIETFRFIFGAYKPKQVRVTASNYERTDVIWQWTNSNNTPDTTYLAIDSRYKGIFYNHFKVEVMPSETISVMTDRIFFDGYMKRPYEIHQG